MENLVQQKKFPRTKSFFWELSEKIKQIKFQLAEIVKGFNGYNGEVILRGIETRLLISKAIDKEIKIDTKINDPKIDNKAIRNKLSIGYNAIFLIDIRERLRMILSNINKL